MLKRPASFLIEPQLRFPNHNRFHFLYLPVKAIQLESWVLEQYRISPSPRGYGILALFNRVAEQSQHLFHFLLQNFHHRKKGSSEQIINTLIATMEA